MPRTIIGLDEWPITVRDLPPMRERDDGWTESLGAYVIRLPVSDLKIVIPRGFLHNWSSVPWFATWLVPRRGPFAKAGFVHDWLFVVRGYQRHEWDRTWPAWVPVAAGTLTRSQCNDEWAELARLAGARAYRRIPGRVGLGGVINRYYWRNEAIRPWNGLIIPGHLPPVFAVT